MMAPVWKRRNVIIGVCAVLLVIVAFSSTSSLDTQKFTSIIPHKPSSDPAATKPEPGAGAGDNLPTDDKSLGAGKPKTSQLHFLIPASNSNIQLCYNVVSSITNRYPVPMLLGWQGTGLLNAHKTHLAKLRAIQKYFHRLEDHEDDDLVVIVDGYDIIMQIPPAVMIERYFQMADQADARLAKRFGISVDEARSKNIRQTVFWGPDKICWPINHKAARCWAVPTSGLPPKAFGPKSGNGEMYYSDPRWLNSGTVIGPISDVKKLVDATMEEIEATYDPDFPQSESDQYYLSNVWGRQEFFRSQLAANGGEVKGGPQNRETPNRRHDEDEVEYHITIDYESALFQTKAGYEPFFGYLQFNESDHNAKQTRDMFELGADFEPFDIQMPPNVVSSMSKLYDDIPDAHPGSDSSDWIKTVKLGTNFVTKHIYALWHCTGPKEWIDKEYPKLWFYPFVRPLIKAAIKSSQEGDLILSTPVNGRYWAPKHWFPTAVELHDQPFGGAWSDVNGTTFVPWTELCGKHEEILFKGDLPEKESEKLELAPEKEPEKQPEKEAAPQEDKKADKPKEEAHEKKTLELDTPKDDAHQ